MKAVPGWAGPLYLHDHNLQGVTVSGKFKERPGESGTCVGPGMFSGPPEPSVKLLKRFPWSLGQTGPHLFERLESLQWRMEVTLKKSQSVLREPWGVARLTKRACHIHLGEKESQVLRRK